MAYSLPWDWDEVSLPILYLRIFNANFTLARHQLHHHQALGYRRLPRRTLRAHTPPTRRQSHRGNLQLNHPAQGQRPQQGQDVPGAQEEPKPPVAHLRMSRSQIVNISFFPFDILLVPIFCYETRIVFFFFFRIFEIMFHCFMLIWNIEALSLKGGTVTRHELMICFSFPSKMYRVLGFFIFMSIASYA